MNTQFRSVKPNKDKDVRKYNDLVHKIDELNSKKHNRSNTSFIEQQKSLELETLNHEKYKNINNYQLWNKLSISDASASY